MSDSRTDVRRPALKTLEPTPTSKQVELQHWPDNTTNNMNSGSTYISSPSTQAGKIISTKHQEEQRRPQLKNYSYHKWKDLQALAAAHKDGITFVDIRNRFGLSKKQAQNMLYSYEKKEKLFTASRRKPQRYFLTKQGAEFAYLKSTYNDHTGVNPSNTYHDYPLTFQPPPMPLLPHWSTDCNFKNRRGLPMLQPPIPC